MIGLNDKVEAKATNTGVGDPVPEGVYEVVVQKVEPWESREFKDVDINKRDDDGYVVKEKGKTVKVKASFTAYNANVHFKIVDGEYEGRYIFANLTTHPDVLFLLEGFLFAIDKDEITLTDLQEEAQGEHLRVQIYHRKWTKKVTDPNTAIEKEEEKTQISVRNFLKTDLVQGETEEETGI